MMLALPCAPEVFGLTGIYPILALMYPGEMGNFTLMGEALATGYVQSLEKQDYTLTGKDVSYQILSSVAVLHTGEFTLTGIDIEVTAPGLFYDIDQTSGAVLGAWGVRKLVAGYSGPLIRIRDTNDNSEQDVGIAADGGLAAFTVVGDAAVKTLYDQSGNGANIVQATTTKQPLLKTGVTPAGGPAIYFDGADDFMADGTTGTTRPYMVADPIWTYGGSGDRLSSTNGWLYSVPQVAGSNTSPYSRHGAFTNNDTLQANALWNGTGSTTIQVYVMRPDVGWGLRAYDSYNGKIYECIPNIPDTAKTAITTITYPSATAIYIGANGAGTERYRGYFTELVCMKASLTDISKFKTQLYKTKMNWLGALKSVWRFNVSANFGSGTGECETVEIEFALTPGGANQVPTGKGGCPAFHDIRFSASVDSSRAFNASYGGYFSTGNVSFPHFIGVDLQQAVDPQEIRVFGSIGGRSDRTMCVFDIQYLGLDGNWVTVKSVDLTSQGHTDGQEYDISIP